MKTADDYKRMREAKARKREALGAVLTVERGRAVFSGDVFGGEHTVRLTSREDAPHLLYIKVDEKLTCVKTERGARALLMRRISREATCNL